MSLPWLLQEFCKPTNSNNFALASEKIASSDALLKFAVGRWTYVAPEERVGTGRGCYIVASVSHRDGPVQAAGAGQNRSFTYSTDHAAHVKFASFDLEKFDGMMRIRNAKNRTKVERLLRWPLIADVRSQSMRVLIIIATLAIAGHSMAADLTTRFGRVTTAGPDQSGRTRVAFEGQSVQLLEADSVSLYRVSVPSGGVEYVIVEKWLAGLNCHNEYLILSIQEDRSFKLTPSFGKCMNLEAASFTKGVPNIRLRTPPSLPGKTRFETYAIENGAVRKK